MRTLSLFLTLSLSVIITLIMYVLSPVSLFYLSAVIVFTGNHYCHYHYLMHNGLSPIALILILL